MKHILSIALLASLIPLIATAAPKEVKVLKITGQVRILASGASTLAAVGQVVPADATVKTYTGAQVTLSIGGVSKVVEENRTLSVAVLAGGDSAVEGALNLLGKFSSKTYSGYGVSAVAGVRGAEQGKKAGFGVQWQGQASARPAAPAVGASDFDQAKALCGSQDFDGAIAKLTSIISASSDPSLKVRSCLLLAQANIELVRGDKAQAAALEGIALTPKEPAVLAQLRFAVVNGAWLTGNAEKTLAAIETHFPASAATGDEYWNAQVVKVLALRASGKKADAKRVAGDVTSNCPIDDLVAAVAQIPL